MDNLPIRGLRRDFSSITQGSFTLESFIDSVVSNSDDHDYCSDSLYGSIMEPPKKKRTRACLNHMSQDDKKKRRKEKNRAAAQNARDKKKAKLEFLERENLRLREENLRLKAIFQEKLQKQQLQQIQPQINICPTQDIFEQSNASGRDSGVSDLDSANQTMSGTSMDNSQPEMEFTIIPQLQARTSQGETGVKDNSNQNHTKKHDKLLNPANLMSSLCEYPSLVGPSTCPAEGAEPASTFSSQDQDCPVFNSDRSESDYLDSIVGVIDQEALDEWALQLEKSLSDPSELDNDNSIETAELISVPQQQVQEMSCQSQSVESSAGWTSIQLMLLLMISRAHRLYSSKTNCCVNIPQAHCIHHSQNVRANIRLSQGGSTFVDTNINSNLYDYLLDTKCPTFRHAIDSILENKSNTRKQKLVALEFMYIYLYNCGRFPLKNNNKNIIHNSPIMVDHDERG